MSDFGCSPHAQHPGVPGSKGYRDHPDFGVGSGNYMADHQRGAAHPRKHTAGRLPAQMNPDHGTHRGAGKHK